MASVGSLVRCAVRVRPQEDSTVPSTVSVQSASSLEVNHGEGTQPATVDWVFQPRDSQGDVYDKTVEPLVHRFVNENLNVALVVLGSAGSGKNYTVRGGGGGGAAVGLVPRIIDGVCSAIDRKSNTAGGGGSTMYDVQATHVELVGENVRDLFAADPERADLDVVETEKGTHVNNVTPVVSTAPEKLREAYVNSCEERTSLSNGSGDEHGVSTFFSLEMTEKVLPIGSSAADQPMTRRCRMQIIQLPAADVLAENPADVRAREGIDKHKAILAFGHLAKQLASDTQEAAIVNYRQSKLTHMMEEVLGGNCVTVVLATIGQDPAQGKAAAATLRYVSNYLQKIRNFPMVVDDTLYKLLRRHRLKVAQLVQEVSALRSGEIGQAAAGGKDMSDHLLAIHELEGRIITANMEKVRLANDRDILLQKFQALRTKYTELTESKAELQKRLILSEEDRLKIGAALIDQQINGAQKESDIEQEAYELRSQLATEQEQVRELEYRQKSEAQKISDLEDTVATQMKEKEELWQEFVALQQNLLNSRKDAESHKRKEEMLSIELLNLVNARNALSAEKETMSMEYREQLALQGNEKMSEETVAELDSLRQGSKELHEEVAKLKFTIQQKEVEYGQLRLQLEKSLAEQTTVARSQATEAESTLSTMQQEMSRLEGQLKQKDRLLKEQESDLQREAARYSELYEEVVMSRQRLQDGDKKFREQVKEHMEDLSRLTSRATPRAEQLNQETRRLIEQMTQQMQLSYSERESTLSSDLALVRERLARATRKNRQLFLGYRELRHRVEDSAPRGSTPTIRREEEVEDGELEGEGQIMEEEMATLRQRVNGLEEDLDRQRQKAITATEAYQKMVVDLQQRHAGTVAELEMALKELDQLQEYKDLYSKLQAGQATKDSQEGAKVLQENLSLKNEIHDLKMELHAAKNRGDAEAARADRVGRGTPDAYGGGGGAAADRPQARELSDEQLREFEDTRRTDRILREENVRLSAELEKAREELAQERGGGMASARAIAEGRASFHKGLKEFAANTLQDLEAELAEWKTRAVVAETELEHVQSYMTTSVRTYQQEIMRMRQLLEQHGVPVPRGGKLSGRLSESREGRMDAERDAGARPRSSGNDPMNSNPAVAFQ